DLPALREGAAGALALGARPEHVRLSDAAPLRARVEAAEYMGAGQIVTLATDFGAVKARLPVDARARPGETVGLTLDARALSLFDAETGRALRTAANEGALAHG
ncbi:MAG: TOBE domain-containing protein, partial [Rubrimonas sp.]